MIRFAVIGTNWITRQFIDATKITHDYQLSAIYSRTPQQAQAFARYYPDVALFTDLTSLACSDSIDAVYIASPNALHFQQIRLFLSQQKHVICEKPLTANLRETETTISLAKQNQLVLFEAFKTASLPNFSLLRQALEKPGKLRKVFLNYCQFSSRYPLYLQTQQQQVPPPNTFNPAFCGGSMMDIGYYCLAFALALWGEPQTVSASASLLASGVDAHGSVNLRYPDFDVTLWHSKVSDSVLASEIQGEAGSLVISKLSDCQHISWYPRAGEVQTISQQQHNNTMIYEADTFARLINAQHIDHPALELSRITAKWLDIIRAQTGVRFPVD